MYGREQECSSTAFKQAEKRYQLHREQQFTNRNGRRRGKGFIIRPVDLSDVIDLHPGARFPGVTCLGVPSGMPPTAAAFAFAAHPGLLVVRGALAPDLQRRLVVDALTLYNEPPNHTNHIKAYPGGLPGIWEAAQQGLRLQLAAAKQQQNQQAAVGPATWAGSDGSSAAAAPAAANIQSDGPASLPADHTCINGSCNMDSGGSSMWSPDGDGPTAESLLLRLRWATLGPPYDWTQRLYLRDVPHMPLPPELRQLAVTLADLTARLLQGSNDSNSSSSGGTQRTGSVAGPAGSCRQQQEEQSLQYCPDAALVNYYYEGDTLNGHMDDAERSLQQPLVSLSLGCDAVFLMGTHTKAEPPTALLLRSGDAVVLSGAARRCYHGVPRILTPGTAVAATAAAAGVQHWPVPVALQCSSSSHGGSNNSNPAAADEEDAFAPFARHMQRCRINISIRDTR